MQGSIEIKIYEDFQKWHENLKDDRAVAKIQHRIDLIEQGSFGDAKSVGGGVTEIRIDYGPGYRMYMGRKGQKLVVLLAGSQKKDQQKTISEAKRIWSELKGEV